MEEKDEPKAEPQPVQNACKTIGLPEVEWQTLRDKLVNEDIPWLQLDHDWRPDQVRELISWDDISIEDPEDSLSLNQDDEFEPRILDSEDHEEIDLIMKVQDMPKGKLNCPEFPHLILIEDPNPDNDVASPSMVIASIMKEHPSEEEEKIIEVEGRCG